MFTSLTPSREPNHRHIIPSSAKAIRSIRHVPPPLSLAVALLYFSPLTPITPWPLSPPPSLSGETTHSAPRTEGVKPTLREPTLHDNCDGRRKRNDFGKKAEHLAR